MCTSELLCTNGGGAFFLLVTDYTTGRVGAPLICCEIKLKDWQEGKGFAPASGISRRTESPQEPWVALK